MGSEKLRVHCAITFLKIFFWFLRVKEKQQQLKKEGKGIVFGYSFFACVTFKSFSSRNTSSSDSD